MANQLVEFDKPFTYDPAASYAVQPEAALQTMTYDEAANVVEVPSIDIKKYQSRNLWTLAGQGMIDGLLQMTTENATTQMIVAGRLEEQRDPRGDKSFQLKVGEKMRDFNIALRNKIGMEQEKIAPDGMKEKLVMGTGAGVTNLLGMLGARAAGASAGFAMGGPAGAAVGGVVIPYAFSYSQERANIAQDLMAAGFKADFVDRVSDIYAFPAAALDYVSFGYLTKLARPLASKAIRTAAGQAVFKGLMTDAGKAVTQAAKGFAAEGGTEALQQRYQTEVEIIAGAKTRDLEKDLTDDVVSGVVGGFLGGTVGAAGQLRVRGEAIERMVEQHAIPRNDAARLYDEAMLRANDMVLDELATQHGVEEDMKWVNKAFNKTEAQQDLSMPEMVDESQTAQEYTASSDAINPEQILVDAKVAEIQRDVRNLQKEQTGLRREIADLTQQKRLVKIDAKNDFIKENGREPKDGELGPWVVNRAVQLETKIATLTEKAAQSEMRLKQSQASFGESIKALPTQQEIGVLEDKLAKAYTAQTDLVTKISEATPDQVDILSKQKDAIDQKISALELRLATSGSRQEAVAAAEKRVEAAATALAKHFMDLDISERQLAALRDNPAVEFATEKGRAPKDAVELKEWVAKKQETLDEQMQKAQTKIDVLAQDIVNAEALAEDFRQNLARVEGRVEMRSSQIRTMARQDLRNIMQAFKAGRKVSEQEFKRVQKSFVTLLKGTHLSKKSVTTLLRKVLTVRTAEQFNRKIGNIVDGVNTILRSEKVRAHQKLGKQIIQEMLPTQEMTPAKKAVSPKAQVFAEHLMRVLRGQVQPNHDLASSDTVEIAKAVVEQAAYDLRHAGDDAGVAARAVKTLSEFYKDNLQRFQDYKDRQAATYERLAKIVTDAVSGGKPLEVGKESLDASRQQARRAGIMATLAPTPYTMSFMSILDAMDKSSGHSTMQGPLVKAFSSEVPFNAWVVHTQWAKDNIDNKMAEIYGKKALEIWKDHIGKDFIEVPYTEDGVQKKQMISRSAAMSMMLMLKMPSVRQDFLKNMGIDQAWLDAFESGDNVGFTKEDYAWMQNVRDVLDQYAEKIAPLYERLTGKPFRKVDNYFMVMRYLNQALSDGGTSETSSVIQTMLNGNFDQLNPADEDRLKERQKSKMALQLPEIYEALSRYALDMNHFLGYAEYGVKLQKAFQNDENRRLMERSLPAGYPPVIDEYIRTIIEGSISRSADRKAMRGFFQLLGTYARNQIAPIKNIPRQFSGLAAFTEIPGIGAVELAESVVDLPRAIKSGELKAILDTAYMKQRYLGMYDFAARYAQDMARADWFSSVRGKGPLSKLRQGLASQTLHNFVTFSSRYGDRAASIVGGWAVYKKVLKQTNNQEAAVKAAIKAIDDTQQSMDPGKIPVAFNRSDLFPRLATLFRRTPAIYLDRYFRAWEAKKQGRISNEQFLKTMMTYHLWVPLFDVLVTAGDWEPWETSAAMAAGPLAYHLILGQLFTSAVAGVLEGVSDNEAELPPYLKDVSQSTLLGSFTKDVTKLLKKIGVMIDEGPDFENMWATTKAAGQVGDISPVPTGWLMQTPEGIYDLFSADWEQMWAGIKKAAGYGEARTTPK